MCDKFYVLYFDVLILGSIVSYFPYRTGDRKFIFILLLFVATLAFELLTLTLRSNGVKGYIFIYDLFNAVEYIFFGIYYLKACKHKWARIWGRLSIILFFIFSLVASYLVYRFEQRAGRILTLNINIECCLLFITYTHLLFNIDDNVTIPIYRHPDFWISVGVLIFYGGVFVLFGLYPMLVGVDTANKEYGFIIRPLNIFLYLSIILGIYVHD